MKPTHQKHLSVVGTQPRPLRQLPGPQTHQRCCPSQIELPENSTKVELYPMRNEKNLAGFFMITLLVAKKCCCFFPVFCSAHIANHRPTHFNAQHPGTHCPSKHWEPQLRVIHVQRHAMMMALFLFLDPWRINCCNFLREIKFWTRPGIWEWRFTKSRPRPPGCLYNSTVTHRIGFGKMSDTSKKPQKQQLI